MKRIALFSIALALFSCTQKTRRPSAKTARANSSASTIVQQDYSICKKHVSSVKDKNRKSWKQLSKPERSKIFCAAIVDTIIPSWIGTDWNFYGTTQTPNEGTIA